VCETEYARRMDELEQEAVERAKRIRELREIIDVANIEYQEQRAWYIDNLGDRLIPDADGKAGPIKFGGILFSLEPGRKNVDSKLLKATLKEKADKFFKQGEPIYYIRNAPAPDLEL
jgi:hypothetical protein